MDIQIEKSNIIERFRHIDDISLINAIKKMLDNAQTKTSKRISIQEYNEELEFSAIQILEGKGIKHNDLKSQMEKW